MCGLLIVTSSSSLLSLLQFIAACSPMADMPCQKVPSKRVQRKSPMALAFHNRQVYKASSTADLTRFLPAAEVVLDGPRDLFVASWPDTIYVFVSKRVTPPACAAALRNNPNYWYEELLKTAINIEIKNKHNSQIMDFTFNAIAPIKVNSSTTRINSMPRKAATKKDEQKIRNHIDKSLKIIKKVVENPRRKGTHGFKSWEKIEDGMTVAQYLQEGGRANDLQWEVKKGHVVLQS